MLPVEESVCMNLPGDRSRRQVSKAEATRIDQKTGGYKVKVSGYFTVQYQQYKK